MRQLKILMYGDMDLNIMDGSAVWLTSMASMLAMNPNVKTDVLLKAKEQNTRLTDGISNFRNVRLVEPFQTFPDLAFTNGNRINVAEALTRMEALDQQNNYHLIIIRGFALVKEMMKHPALMKKTIPYITDFNHDPDTISAEERADLRQVYDAFPNMFLQTEATRAIFSELMEVDGKKVAILSPMIPAQPITPDYRNRHNQLIYSGKFAEEWYTEEIIRAAKQMTDKDVTFCIVGDKFQGELRARKGEVQQAFQETANIDWVGAVSRAESQAYIAQSDIGISWRSETIDNDASVELSTKLLEYARLGKPVLLRRTKMHEQLLGSDYELFVDTEADFLEKAQLALTDSAVYKRAAKTLYEASQHFTLEASYNRLKQLLWSYNKEPLNLLFASHDLKFMTDIIDYLIAQSWIKVKIDHWNNHTEHDAAKSQELLEWADMIFCEWGLGNAVWYSKYKKPDQKLLVRVHAQEKRTQHPFHYNLEAIDHIIAVCPFILEEMHRICQIPRHKMILIANTIDTEKLDRPKQANIDFNIGICGVVPKIKGLDKAIDIFEQLWQTDKRYTLFIKGKLPKDVTWLMGRTAEREYYEAVFARIQAADWKDSVVFDKHGNDVHEWLQKIGYLLSTSESESFHTVLMEGMAAGTTPCLLSWPGVDTVYPAYSIFQSPEAIVEFIQNNTLTKTSQQMYKDYAYHYFNKAKICREIEALIVATFEG
ncbi:glycosyltransferase family 4 protein [Listeria booriae]|uniref:Glycosyltransferase family 4 protein n=1 Tax=Listeria booriae TaxID=1552123 RepID=A0A841YRT1_9LIST|nr:glycosyltransferase [Listeria booriae]MBC1403221.1 glycosyltransferase family 4 protein [Listeria booriae]MBC1618091.1 glycosyltransferase family 4 protein [Listeria booriae]